MSIVIFQLFIYTYHFFYRVVMVFYRYKEFIAVDQAIYDNTVYTYLR